ncbi:hypothetical protein M2275_007793 [Rhodococcus opacus]|nr:hypothetical protein [Rhodococcus opacus]
MTPHRFIARLWQVVPVSNCDKEDTRLSARIRALPVNELVL